MVSGQISNKTLNEWDKFSHSEKIEILRLICGEYGTILKRRFSSILAIGLGFKTKGNFVVKDLCLAFLVKEKKDGKPRPVPPAIKFSLNFRGKRTRLAIPTDVEELGEGKPHAVVNVAGGIHAVLAQNPQIGIFGSACCVVSQDDNAQNRYVLGCHHVLALSLLTRDCDAEDGYLQVGNQTIGRLYEYLPMSASGQACIDAAIAILDPDVPVIWEQPNIAPSNVSPGITQPSNCWVFSPNGPLQAEFVREWADVPLNYPNAGTVIIRAAYQFSADTKPGHSGSPIMEPDGTLHGMHFWGDSSRRMSFAIPAFVLFQPGLFSVSFNL